MALAGWSRRVSSALVLSLACHGPQGRSPAPALSAATVAPPAAMAPPPVATPIAPAPSASPEPVNSAAEAEARALVDAWLGAQNRSDFAAYRALYAAKFEGIKRVGARASRFDREGWLKDRERMFQPPSSGARLRVELGELSLQSSATSTRARFVQSFWRGSFSDRGRKELLLVREGKALRIAREELLESELSAAPAPRGAQGARFLFVIPEGVVLSQSGDPAAARGPLELTQGAPYVVRSAVDPARLDPASRALIGRRLLLGGRRDCSAKIGKLALVVRVDPHFSMLYRWRGEPELEGDRPGPPATDAEIARELWELGSPELVAELGELPEGCQASWARDAALPIAQLEAPSPAVPPALRARAEHQMLAAAQRVSPAPAGLQPALSVHRVGGQHPLLVGHYARGESCEEELSLSFIWAMSGSAAAPRLELLNDPERTPDFSVEQAIDLDGDGRWELLGNEGSNLLEPSENYEHGAEISITELNCRC